MQTAQAARASQPHVRSDRDGPTQSEQPAHPAPARPVQPSPLSHQSALTPARPHQLMLAEAMQPSLCSPAHVSSAYIGATYASRLEWIVMGFKTKHLGKYT